MAKMTKAGQSWPKLAKAGQSWPKLAKAGQNWPKLAKAGQNWPKAAKAGRVYDRPASKINKDCQDEMHTGWLVRHQSGSKGMAAARAEGAHTDVLGQPASHSIKHSKCQ
jgi:hypothetical protein